jgi:hypothetical protein
MNGGRFTVALLSESVSAVKLVASLPLLLDKPKYTEPMNSYFRGASMGVGRMYPPCSACGFVASRLPELSALFE